MYHSGVKRIIQIFGALVLIIVMIEVGISLLRGLNTKTVVAQWGEIEKGYWTEALFLREETLLRAPLDGELVIKIDPGTRVPRGELVSYINGPLERVNTSELNVQARMELESLIREERAYRADLERIKSEIREMALSLKRAAGRAKTAADVAALKREETRVTELLKETHIKLWELRKKIKDQLQQQALIMAPRPGYLFYEYDGWEDKLSPDSYPQIMEEELRRDYSLKKPGRKVRSGEIIGKIIDPFRQVIVVTAAINKTGLPEPGNTWWVKLQNVLQPATVLESRQLSENKAIVALEDQSLSPDFFPGRRFRIFIVYCKKSGIMVPRSSLLVKPNLTQVKVVKGESFKFKDVRIMATDDHNAIIDGLEFGATIISR